MLNSHVRYLGMGQDSHFTDLSSLYRHINDPLKDLKNSNKSQLQ